MIRGRRYFLGPDDGECVTPSRLKRFGRARQREYVLRWFFENFEDPVHAMPIEDGSYEYIYGGPYYPREELDDEFGDIVKEEVLAAAAEEIQAQGMEWAPSANHPDRDTVAPEPDLYDLEFNELEELVRLLRSGAKPTYGSSAELRLRQEIVDRIAALKAELRSASARPPGMGHNNPPLEDGEALGPETALLAMQSACESIETELKKHEPDAFEVAEKTSILRRMGTWLGGKVDLFVEEATKSAGKAVGAGAVALGAVEAAKIDPLHLAGLVIDAVLHWLQMVLPWI